MGGEWARDVEFFRVMEERLVARAELMTWWRHVQDTADSEDTVVPPLKSWDCQCCYGTRSFFITLYS